MHSPIPISKDKRQDGAGESRGYLTCLEQLTQLASEGLQSSYALQPHGPTSHKQRTVAAAAAPDSRLCSSKGGPRRRTVSDEAALHGFLFVLQTGIPWEDLPQSMGFGSGMTCWRRLRDWQAAGVWHRLHLLLLGELRGAGKLDFSRASMDAASAASTSGRICNSPE